MRVTAGHPGSGTHAEDSRREAAGKLAAQNLELGRGSACVVGDHGASELCVDVINRLANNLTKVDVSPYARTTACQAAGKLKHGWGVNKKDTDHSGGNTCVALLAAVPDNF
jgi:hypothetical protein